MFVWFGLNSLYSIEWLSSWLNSLRLVMAYSLRLITALSIKRPSSWPSSCQCYPPRPPWQCCPSPLVRQRCGLWPALPCMRSLQVQPGSNILQRRWVHRHTYNGFWILTAGALFKGVVRGLTWRPMRLLAMILIMHTFIQLGLPSDCSLNRVNYIAIN